MLSSIFFSIGFENLSIFNAGAVGKDSGGCAKQIEEGLHEAVQGVSGDNQS